LPAGVGTLTSDNNAARSRFFDLIVAEGIVSERGVWEREPGAVRYTNSPIGPRSVGATFTTPRNPSGGAAVVATYRLAGTAAYVGNIASISSGGAPGAQAFVTGLAAPSGSAIFVQITQDDAVDSSAVTDSAGNTYTKIGSVTFGGDGHVELWASLAVNPLPAGGTITVTFAAGIAIGQAHCFTGLLSLDQSLTATVAPGGSVISSTDLTPRDASEQVIFAYGDRSNATNMTATPTGMTLEAGASTGGPGWGTRLAHGVMPFTLVPPNALTDYWTSASVQRLLALGSDGIAYKSSGGAFTALTMATTMADQPGSMIVVGGQEQAGASRKAFFFDNGVTKIQTLTGDGLSTTNFGNNWNTTTNIPADWATNPPRGGVIHKERLWAWSPANAPHNIYASKLRDHENFKNAVGGSLEYVQEIGTGVGLRIAAAVSFKGMLFAFKFPRGVYFLDDTDVDFLNWRWNEISNAIGVADSPYSVIVLDDDVLFISPDGHMHFLSAVTQQGVATSDLTPKLNLQEWTRDNIALNRLGHMASTYYPAKKLAILGLSRLASTSNDLRVFLDFSNALEEGQTVRLSYSYRDVNRVLALRRDESDGAQRPILAEDDGLVWKMDQPSKIKVGVPNAGQARYQYSPTDLSHTDPNLKNKRKLFDALTINFNPTGSWNLAVDSIIDGEYRETLYFSMGGGVSVLGTFMFGDPLGGGSITTSRRRMTGHGYWLSLAGWVQGEGHDFSVASHTINYRPGGEEQRA
jgi:hypothetical protein